MRFRWQSSPTVSARAGRHHEMAQSREGFKILLPKISLTLSRFRTLAAFHVCHDDICNQTCKKKKEEMKEKSRFCIFTTHYRWLGFQCASSKRRSPEMLPESTTQSGLAARKSRFRKAVVDSYAMLCTAPVPAGCKPRNADTITGKQRHHLSNTVTSSII